MGGVLDQLGRFARGTDRDGSQPFYWSHLLLAAFFTVAIGDLLFSVPAVEFGTARPEYSAAFLVRTIFPLMAAALALGSTRLRDRSRDQEASLRGWSKMRDKLTSIRRQEYFLDRVALECERVKREGGSFAVFVLRLQAARESSVDPGLIERALGLLRARSNDADCVSALGASELALLLPGMRADLAPAASERLQKLVSLEAGDGLKVRGGWALYRKEEAPRPAELLARARVIR